MNRAKNCVLLGSINHNDGFGRVELFAGPESGEVYANPQESEAPVEIIGIPSDIAAGDVLDHLRKRAAEIWGGPEWDFVPSDACLCCGGLFIPRGPGDYYCSAGCLDMDRSGGLGDDELTD